MLERYLLSYSYFIELRVVPGCTSLVEVMRGGLVSRAPSIGVSQGLPCQPMRHSSTPTLLPHTSLTYSPLDLNLMNERSPFVIAELIWFVSSAEADHGL